MVSIHEARDEKPCKMNSSPQLLSSVSLPDFKLSPGVTQLGELSAVVTVLSNILLWAQPFSIHNIYAFPSDFHLNSNCIVRWES